MKTLTSLILILIVAMSLGLSSCQKDADTLVKVKWASRYSNLVVETGDSYSTVNEKYLPNDDFEWKRDDSKNIMCDKIRVNPELMEAYITQGGVTRIVSIAKYQAKY